MTVEFPEGAAVLVRYPVDDNRDRSQWPWLPGIVAEQCGPDEWTIDLDNGAWCFRGHTEIRSSNSK